MKTFVPSQMMDLADITKPEHKDLHYNCCLCYRFLRNLLKGNEKLGQYLYSFLDFMQLQVITLAFSRLILQSHSLLSTQLLLPQSLSIVHSHMRGLYHATFIFAPSNLVFFFFCLLLLLLLLV
jgi:hypothetical protein